MIISISLYCNVFHAWLWEMFVLFAFTYWYIFCQPDLRNGFSLPAHLTMANFTAQGGEHSRGTQQAGQAGSGLASYVAGLIDRSGTIS